MCQETLWKGKNNAFVNIFKLFCFKYDHDRFFLRYFVICQKYLWIVEIPCPYFKVISKGGCYLLTGNLVFISGSEVSFLRQRNEPKDDSSTKVTQLLLPDLKTKVHFTVIWQEHYRYYSKGRMTIFNQAFIKNSFTGNLGASAIKNAHSTSSSSYCSSTHSWTCTNRHILWHLTSLTRFRLVHLQWMKMVFATYYYSLLRLDSLVEAEICLLSRLKEMAPGTQNLKEFRR